jgi:Ca2+-binding RTX toxin-like protein
MRRKPLQPFLDLDADDALAVTFAGSTVAVGQDTLSQADVTVRVIDRGRFTFAYGQADLVASSLSDVTELAYAAVDAQWGIFGADITVESSLRLSGQGEINGGSWSTEISRSGFFALDIEGISLVCEPDITLFRNDPRCSRGQQPLQPPNLDGNVANASFDATAFGHDTFVDVVVDNLAVEGQLSNTSVAITATAASATPVPPPVIGSRCDDVIIEKHGDNLILSGRGDDCIETGAGDDLILAGSGRDRIQAGSGNNTVVAGDGKDHVSTGKGDDWVYGGDGDDWISAGAGNDLIDGGGDDDRIYCGAGDDLVRGGCGDDVIDAGNGDDWIFLGEGPREQGKDSVNGGAGADLFFVDGGFGKDVVRGFVIAEGDRIIYDRGDWDSDQGLRSLNGANVFLERGVSDKRDLEITIRDFDAKSVLILDDFFHLNAAYQAPRRGLLSDDEALPMLRDIFADLDSVPPSQMSADLFRLGDLLALFG